MSALTAGFAAVEITPPLGVPMSGYGSRDKPAESLVDPLYAHATVLANADTAIAIVCADLIGLSERVFAPIRQRIAAQSGIDEANIMITCSHTHWGPELCDSAYIPRKLLALQSPEYLEELTQKLADAVTRAHQGRVAAVVAAGSGFAANVTFNRRPVSVEQKVVMSLALPPAQALVASREGNRLAKAWVRGEHLGPRLSGPLPELEGVRVGPADAEVIVLRLDKSDGTPLCALTNFACHAVCGDDDNMYGFSADFPGAARAAFEALIGAPMAFIAGCSGDQVPRWRRGKTRERVGKPVGAEAAHVWLGLDECHGEVPLAAARKRVKLPVNANLPNAEEARRKLTDSADPESTSAAMERQTVEMVEEIKDQDGYEVEMWAMRIGDLGLVGIPGETLTEIGLQIKQRSPLPYTMLASLTNGALGYIPTDNAVREGGYEPSWSPVGEGSERVVVDTALELLNSLL